MRATAPSVCPHDCPSQCALEVTVEAGRITGVTGDPRHPFTRGVICGKVHDYAERVYGITRVLTPLRRVGAKGEGRFEPREVKLGHRGKGYVEIREGLAEDDPVVTSANFLIDAESNLKAALKGFAEGAQP